MKPDICAKTQLTSIQVGLFAVLVTQSIHVPSCFLRSGAQLGPFNRPCWHQKWGGEAQGSTSNCNLSWAAKCSFLPQLYCPADFSVRSQYERNVSHPFTRSVHHHHTFENSSQISLLKTCSWDRSSSVYFCLHAFVVFAPLNCCTFRPAIMIHSLASDSLKMFVVLPLISDLLTGGTTLPLHRLHTWLYVLQLWTGWV